MPLIRVHITGGDHVGWAQDEGMRLTRLALADRAEIVDLAYADVVHSMWWRGALALPRRALVGKRVVSYVGEEVYRLAGEPEHLEALERVTQWIARGTRDQRQLSVLGIEAARVPYPVDVATFTPLGHDDPAVQALRQRWRIPDDRYLIGSFQRDTEGADLVTPKLVKGPDVLAEIARVLHARGYPIHIVLAGPRRRWIRDRLTALGVPFTYIGEDVSGDDIRVNTAPRSLLNLLYNLVDLYLVTSRSENAPNSVMEAAAAGCAITSSDVGIAPDVLDPACLWRTIPDAIALIERDLASRALRAMVERHRARIADAHTPVAIAPLIVAAYERALAAPPLGDPPVRSIRRRLDQSLIGRAWRRLVPSRPSARAVVSLWNTFYPPPYGGANQFMRALEVELRERGVRVVENSSRADVHILQSIWFDVRRFERACVGGAGGVIHRLDGPVELIRGRDRERDEEAMALNASCADATVVQSAWCLENLVRLGHQPRRPVVIHNAADARIFHPRGRVAFSRERKVRLISASWSDNPRKGGALYAFLDRHLDWDRFEYTFVGRLSEPLARARVIPPVPSMELAELLRQHDVYITASVNDPCSNALIEALSCGLPALYRDAGGHPELVRYAGLPFRDESDVLAQLDRLVQYYEALQGVLSPPSIGSVTDRYLGLIAAVAP
jgi:glycosyltransferase involved in cell wall biosynthesis